jgi:hypothetical protein
MAETIKVKLFDTLGCSVASTALIYSLKDKFQDKEIEIYTKFPELFEGIKGIQAKLASTNVKFDVDLSNYLDRRPHNNIPFRPLYVHMIEIAEEQLNVKLKRFLPKINLSKEEIEWAKKELNKYKKPVIWIQSKTNSLNKDLPQEYWKIIIQDLSKDYELIDLSNSKFSIRQSIVISKVSKGG